MNYKLALVLGILVAGAAVAGTTGKVLLLDNGAMIEGDIRREGDHFIVRRGAGETTIPAARVIELAADRHGAYLAMGARCNRRDVDERMRLVRWCVENGLREEAVAEAEALYQFRPDDTRLRALVEGLRADNARPAGPSRAPAAPPKLSTQVLEPEALEFNRESYSLFTARVQPILINLCARCHATGEGGQFTLVGVGSGDRKATMHNLAVALKQLKRNDPTASPLLTKAVTAHGKMAHPPIRNRESPAFENLEMWARQAVIPEETAATSPPPEPMKPAVLDSKPVPKATIFGETSTSQPKPELPTQARDPFDPAIFNGTIQPKN